MKTLADPKHEAFATLRASGHDVASAYVHAGYSVKNIKQRSRKLLQNPDIKARTEYLKTCLPRIEELHAHHCPTLRLMPETRHEMLAWLWQVMNGTRAVKPAQMRAATLYCRLQGWHLAKLLPQSQAQAGGPAPVPFPDAADRPPIPSSTLTEAEKTVLAFSNQENLDEERTGKPRSPENLALYQSALASLADPDCRKDSFGRPLPDLISRSTPTAATTPPSAPTPAFSSNNPPIQQSHAPASAPVSRSSAPSTNPIIQPSINPPTLPHPKPLTLKQLPALHPQPRTFFLSSKADPASAGPIPSRLNLPPRKFPRPLAAAH